jgi:uncharacterized protein with beta-barrel porin domain
MSTDRYAFAGDYLTASFNAESFGARAESGYRVATALGALTSYAAPQAQNFHTPSYSETDVSGGGFGLSMQRAMPPTPGANSARPSTSGYILDRASVLALRAKRAWAHNSVDDPPRAATFHALPIVQGATPAKNAALTSSGAQLRLVSGVSLLGKCDGEFRNPLADLRGDRNGACGVVT